MDLDLLRTFIEVHRLRSFGNAAKSLFVTQAAVSARIKLLESQLGAELFDRSRREVRITAEGHRFLHYADSIIAEWRRARHSIGFDGKHAEHLTIAGSLRLWDVFLQDGWLHALRKAQPELVITAECGTPEGLITRLFDGVIDVAVMLEPPRVELMKTTWLTKIDLVLVSTEPDQTVAGALGEGYVWVDWGQSFESEHYRRFPDSPPSRTVVSDPGMALAYLRVLGGAAFLPGRIIGKELQAGRLHPVAESPVITRSVFGVHLARNPRAELIHRALAILDSGKRIDRAELVMDQGD